MRYAFAVEEDVRFLDDGNVVDPGMPVLRLVESSVIEARIGMPVGAAAKFVVDASSRLRVGDRDFDARVKSLLPVLDRTTRTRTVVFEFTGSDASIVPGEVVRIDVIETVQEPGFWLPLSALTRGTRGLWSVYVVENENGSQGGTVIARRDVEVLHTAADRAFVRGTLIDGDRIVSDGTHRVVPGQHVEAVGREQASREQAGREHAGREQAGREQAGRGPVSTEAVDES